MGEEKDTGSHERRRRRRRTLDTESVFKDGRYPRHQRLTPVGLSFEMTPEPDPQNSFLFAIPVL